MNLSPGAIITFIIVVAVIWMVGHTVETWRRDK